jgi:hypothetical protein
MKKLNVIAMACLLTSALTTQAENKQTLVVGGQTVENSVKKITFEGDDVVLYLSDGTSMTHDMGEVNIAFEWNDATTAIERVDRQTVIMNDGVYDLQGRRVNNAQLRGGIYLVRQNGKTIKILKK